MPTLRDLASWLTACRSVVCAETGISHLCRALDVPCTVVYGGFADPAWNGYREQNNITTSIPCGPCYSGDPCPMSPPKECLRAITVEAVEQSALLFTEPWRPHVGNR
jgi:ADP-heptose:LPS heptosyltransferase